MRPSENKIKGAGTFQTTYSLYLLGTELQHTGTGSPGVRMQIFCAELSAVPSPGEALTCHSMGDAGDHHSLCLCLDSRVWALHLHHESFNLQSRGWDGCEEWAGGSPGSQHCRGVGTAVPQQCMQGPQPSLNLWRCHLQTWQLTLPLDTHTARASTGGTGWNHSRRAKEKMK